MRVALAASFASTALAVVGTAGPAGPAQGPQTPDQAATPVVVDYKAITNPRSEYATFNPEVVRGFAFDDKANKLFSIHAHASTLLVFDTSTGGGSAPIERWRTVTDPVSVRLHGGFLFVVGQGNHVLAKHDAATGAILDLVQLGSEPGDMVIDSNGEAWISCMASDEVQHVQLSPSLAVLDSYSWNEGLELKRPRFLTHQPATSKHPERILVAPLVSGNGTFGVDKYVPGVNFNAGARELDTTEIHDGYSAAFAGSLGLNGYGVLPDEDLFAIELGSTIQVAAVARTVGTLLNAHGEHPKTGDYWMLGIESDNANPALQTEPDLNGIFATNELSVILGGIPSIAAVGGAPAGLVLPGATTDVDLLPSGAYDPTGAGSLSFPYALAFGEVHKQTVAAVAGSTTPNVSLFSSFGKRVAGGDMSLSNSPLGGRVVRSLEFRGDRLFIYCQDTSNILVWDFYVAASGQVLPQPIASQEFHLGEDPTPLDIAAGRSIWYDATRSLNGRVSCNTCHPGGESDGLSWPLTHDTLDFKDNMITQTLDGALDSYPLHWRGERDLIDFNDAFPGLLGGGPGSLLSEGPGGEFEEFKAFVFALQTTANAQQNPDRRVHATDVPGAQPNGYVGDAAVGHEMFVGNIGIHIAGSSQPDIPVAVDCNRCHTMPTGSIGLPFINQNGLTLVNDGSSADFIHSDFAFAAAIETAALHNMGNLRRQPQVDFTHNYSGGAATYELPLLGFGFLHAGVTPSQTDFLLDNFLARSQNVNALDHQDAADLSAFMDVFDSGTAPSVHLGFRLVGGTSNASTVADIQSLLVDQADPAKRWVDVVVLGTSEDDSGNLVRQSWWYDPGLSAFICEDSNVSPASLADFASGSGWENVFLGCLPGQGERLGVDYDNDGLRNSNETAPLSPYVRDYDNDGYPDGYERAVTGLNELVPNVPADNDDSVIHFETAEPVRWTMSGANLQMETTDSHSDTFARRHTAVLRNLLPSGTAFSWTNNYRVLLTLEDIKGNTTPMIVTGGFDAGQSDQGETIVLMENSLTDQGTAGGVRSGQYEVRLGDLGVPDRSGTGDRVVVVHLLRRATAFDDWEFVPPGDIEPSSAPFMASTLTMKFTTQPPTGPPVTHTRIWDPSSHYTDGSGVTATFLVLAPTDGAGWTGTTIGLSGASASQDIAVQVVSVFERHDPATYSQSAPELDFNSRRDYKMPMTHRDLRMVDM
jgi:hypothetical protein